MTSDPPSCFHRVVCLHLLDPAAPFLLFLRKLVLLNGAVVAVLSLVFFLMNAASIGGKEGSHRDRSLMAMASQLILASSSLISYGNAIRTGQVPGWAVALQMYGNGFGALVALPTGPVFPWGMATFSFAIFGMICDMPFRGPFYVILAAIFWVSSVNIINVTLGQEAPLAMRGAPVPAMATQLRDYATIFILACVPVVACMLQARYHRTLLDKVEAANDLSRDVAELLRNYDTAGVELALEAYGALSHADPALIASYAALVANLNQYRPHLPNWMIMRDVDEDEELTARDDEDDAGSARSARSAASQAKSRPQSAKSRRSATSEHSRRSVMADPNAAPPTEQLVDTNRSVSTVAFALVDYRVDADLFRQAQAVSVNGFVDLIHRLAAATHGAIHTFVGDTVQLSWNAAMKCAQPEVKAARFLPGPPEGHCGVRICRYDYIGRRDKRQGCSSVWRHRWRVGARAVAAVARGAAGVLRAGQTPPRLRHYSRSRNHGQPRRPHARRRAAQRHRCCWCYAHRRRS
jgi:hypothetical protein